LATPNKKPVPKTAPKATSLREHAAKSRDKAAQPRRLRQASATAKKPVNALVRLIKTVLRPFSFVLLPFKTRRARFVGRIISKIFLLGYFVNSWKELREVDWPDRRTTLKLMLAVIIFSTIFGIFITLVDYVLDKLFRSLLI